MQAFAKERLYQKYRVFHVLVVDDSATQRSVVELALAHAGHRVTAVSDATQALACAHATVFDAVIMAIDLPGMDGISASLALRDLESKRGGRAPIIALTTRSQVTPMDGYKAASIDVSLLKPFDVNVLLQTLESVMAPMLDVFNRAELLERVGGDEELLVTVVGVFRADADNMLNAVHDAVTKGNAPMVERSAHKLKGALANLSAASAMHAAKGLEDMGRHNTLEKAEVEFTTLAAAMRTLDSHLRALTDR